MICSFIFVIIFSIIYRNKIIYFSEFKKTPLLTGTKLFFVLILEEAIKFIELLEFETV